LDGLIQTRGNVAKERETEPKASDEPKKTSRRRVILPAFLNSGNIPAQVFGSGHPNTETIK
jgi:hypothetical protein